MQKLSGMLSAVGLVCCGLVYAGEAAAESDAKFLKSYKQSFLESCIESSGGKENEATCRCVLDDLVSKFSVAELKDSKKVNDYVENVAVPKCQK